MLSLALFASFASAATLTAGAPFDGSSSATSVAAGAIPSSATLRWAQWCTIEVDSATDVPCLALGATSGSTAYSAIVLDGTCPSGGDCLGGYPILYQGAMTQLSSLTFASTWSFGVLRAETLSVEAFAALATNGAHTAGTLNISNGFFMGSSAYALLPGDVAKSLEMAQAAFAIERLSDILFHTFSPWGDADDDGLQNGNDGSPSDRDDDGIPDEADVSRYGHYVPRP